MAIDPTISLNARAPDSLSNLSTLANTAQAIQSYQRTKATMPADIAMRQAESRTALANANVAEQTQQPLIAQQRAITSQSQTAAQRASLDLQNEQHQRAIQTIIGLVGDDSVRSGDPAGINNAINLAADNAVRYGANRQDVEATLAPVRQMAVSNPKNVQPMLLNLLHQGLTASEQQSAVQPNYMSTGQQLVQTKPGALGPSAITATVAPGQQDALETDPVSGSAVVVSRDARGNIIGSRPVGTPGGSGGIPPQAVPPTMSGTQPQQSQQAATATAPARPVTPSMSFPTGETRDTQAQLLADRQNANEVARSVPTQMDNISQSLHILDQPGALNKTGTGAGFLAKIAGTVGVPVSGDYATNYNTIAHALAIQSGTAAKAMGAGTDAAREVQSVATGTVEQDPKSLRMALTTNRALLGGAADFNNGMEKAIQSRGVFAARQFKNDWANNFDVELYRLHTAAKAGDIKTVNEVNDRLGPQRIKDLTEKWDNLQSLINTGALPNGQ